MSEPSATVVQSVAASTSPIDSDDQFVPSIDPSAKTLPLVVRIGRANYLPSDLEKLTAGSTLVLDELAADPVDIFVGGKLAARGEVLLDDGKYCIRICEIISPAGEGTE